MVHTFDLVQDQAAERLSRRYPDLYNATNAMLPRVVMGVALTASRPFYRTATFRYRKAYQTSSCESVPCIYSRISFSLARITLF